MIKKFTYILIISLTILPLQGTVSEWIVNSSGNWNDGTNWDTNPVFPNAIDDTANFLGAIMAPRNVTLGQNITIGTVNFNDNNPYTIQGGNTLTFSVSVGSGAITIPVGNTGAHSMTCAVSLSSSLITTLASGANFTISGAISGAGGITKNGTGAGSFFLGNTGTYLGSTTVNTGNMTYNFDGCIPGNSAVLIGDGSGSAARLSVQQDMTGNAFAATLGSNGTLFQAANTDVLLTSLASASATSSVALTAMAGAGALFQVSGSTSTTFAGVISGGASNPLMNPSNASRLTKAGTSVLTLTGNNTYSSRTFIQNGVILARTNNALGITGTNSGVFVRDTTPTLGTLGTLRIDNNITLPKRILINGTGFSGEGAIHNVGGNNTISSLGALVIGWSFAGQETASDPTIQVDNGTSLTVAGVVSGTSNLTKSGLGTLTYSGTGANTQTGLTIINQGLVRFNKTAGTNATAGSVTINNGGTLELQAANQIINTRDITINTGGTFNMGSNVETINALNFNGGIITNPALLTIASNSFGLNLGDGVTVPGPIAFITMNGGISYVGSTTQSNILGTVNLGTLAQAWSSNSGPAVSIDISGVISNSAPVTKSGAGNIQISGSSSNTQTGTFTISAGTLSLNKSANVVALGGNAIVQGGALNFLNDGQLTSSTTLTLNSGSISLAGFTETLSTLILNAGTISNSGGTFNLASAGTALSMRNLTLGENLIISGGGDIVFDATNNGTATISGNVTLDFITSFDIAQGTANEDMLISGSIIGAGGLFKTGTGVLRITGANTYAGGTTISQGTLSGTTTSLIGSIIDEGTLTFDQSFDGTFPGTITGVTGSLIKQGTGSVTLTNANTIPGPVTVSEGTLVVNGSINGGGSFLVGPNGTLKGTGTIEKNVTLQGTLKPGNSIGTIHLIGDQVFASGSNLEIDLNLTTSDLVDITGSLTIQPGSIVTVVADHVDYPDQFSYTIIQTTGGVTGTFDHLVNMWFLFEGALVYTPNSVLLRGLILPFSRFVATGNARAIACCLDRLPFVRGTDLANIIEEIRFIPNMEDFQCALDQLQPSLYTGMTIAAQDDLWYLKNAIYNHLDEDYLCHSKPGCYRIWATFLGADTKQRSRCDIGFHNHSYGALVGVDTYAIKPVRLGAGLGYTHDNLHWKCKRGKGRNNTLYGLFYGDWKCNVLALQGILSGALNWYSLTRSIHFTGLNTVCRTAHGKPRGMEFFASIRGELLFNTWPVNIYPYINLDYYYLKRDSFQESGAGSISLRFTNYHADLLITEGGIQFSRSFCCSLTPYFNISVINESRFRGDKQTSYINCCPFITEGLFPSRTLLGLGAGLNYSINSCYEISAYYKGRYGHSFKDNSFYLSLRMNK